MADLPEGASITGFRLTARMDALWVHPGDGTSGEVTLNEVQRELPADMSPGAIMQELAMSGLTAPQNEPQ